MTTNKNPGIYVHIPFCVRKCNYCAFLSGASDEALRERYVKALCEEIRIRARLMSDHAHGVFDTIFFGGGTPSLLTSAQVARIIDELKMNFDIDSEAEVTLESNPKALSMESLKGYRDAGVNRLSMGVQSMDDDILRRLGRIHTARDVIRDVQNAREAGFDNINLDLMFAVPGSSLETTLIDIEAVTRLEPEHISFYSLQLEEGTAFFKEFEMGKLTEVTDEIDRAMYHAGTKRRCLSTSLRNWKKQALSTMRFLTSLSVAMNLDIISSTGRWLLIWGLVSEHLRSSITSGS